MLLQEGDNPKEARMRTLVCCREVLTELNKWPEPYYAHEVLRDFTTRVKWLLWISGVVTDKYGSTIDDVTCLNKSVDSVLHKQVKERE